MTVEIELHVGMRIRDFRRLRGLSQRRLGDLIGVRDVQIYKYEKGLNRVSASALYEIACALDVQISYFYPDPGGAERASANPGPLLVRETTRHFSAIRNKKHREAFNRLVRILAGH